MKQRRQPCAVEPSAPPLLPAPDAAAALSAGRSARVLTAILAQAISLHELLDVSSMHDQDEVRLLVEGIVAGLRAATGAN